MRRPGGWLIKLESGAASRARPDDFPPGPPKYGGPGIRLSMGKGEDFGSLTWSNLHANLEESGRHKDGRCPANFRIMQLRAVYRRVTPM